MGTYQPKPTVNLDIRVIGYITGFYKQSFSPDSSKNRDLSFNETNISFLELTLNSVLGINELYLELQYTKREFFYLFGDNPVFNKHTEVFIETITQKEQKSLSNLVYTIEKISIKRHKDNDFIIIQIYAPSLSLFKLKNTYCNKKWDKKPFMKIVEDISSIANIKFLFEFSPDSSLITYYSNNYSCYFVLTNIIKPVYNIQWITHNDSIVFTELNFGKHEFSALISQGGGTYERDWKQRSIRYYSLYNWKLSMDYLDFNNYKPVEQFQYDSLTNKNINFENTEKYGNKEIERWSGKVIETNKHLSGNKAYKPYIVGWLMQETKLTGKEKFNKLRLTDEPHLIKHFNGFMNSALELFPNSNVGIILETPVIEEQEENLEEFKEDQLVTNGTSSNINENEETKQYNKWNGYYWVYEVKHIFIGFPDFATINNLNKNIDKKLKTFNTLFRGIKFGMDFDTSFNETELITFGQTINMLTDVQFNALQSYFSP